MVFLLLGRRMKENKLKLYNAQCLCNGWHVRRFFKDINLKIIWLSEPQRMIHKVQFDLHLLVDGFSFLIVLESVIVYCSDWTCIYYFLLPCLKSVMLALVIVIALLIGYVNVSWICWNVMLFYSIANSLTRFPCSMGKCKYSLDMPLKCAAFWNVRLIDFHTAHQRILGLQHGWWFMGCF